MSVLSRIRSIQEPGDPGPTRRASRPAALVALTLLLIAFATAAFYTVDTGAVGVEKTLGRVDLEEPARAQPAPSGSDN